MVSASFLAPRFPLNISGSNEDCGLGLYLDMHVQPMYFKSDFKL